MMSGAAEAIHDCNPEAAFRPRLGNNAVKPAPIEFAEIAKQVCRRFA